MSLSWSVLVLTSISVIKRACSTTTLLTSASTAGMVVISAKMLTLVTSAAKAMSLCLILMVRIIVVK